MAAGMFYWLWPRLYRTDLYSKRLANAHFWLAISGIAIYLLSMWVSGITQGLMWRGLREDGTLLYPAFVETLQAIRPMYVTRLLGGLLYLTGFVLMIWNLYQTARRGSPVNQTAEVVVRYQSEESAWVTWKTVLAGRPLWFTLLALVLSVAFAMASFWVALLMALGILVVSELGYVAAKRMWSTGSGQSWFGLVERRPLIFTCFVLVSILIGGIAELVPAITVAQAVPITEPVQKPYTPLELAGRDIYIREGCYVCHSQMIRPMLAEHLRYGPASRASEFIYDHPFQWGSKRTGPDLQRLGGRYPNLWHYAHLMDPRSTSPGSNMPSYSFLARQNIDSALLDKRLALMRKLGVPYTSEEVETAALLARRQADTIVQDLAKNGVTLSWDSEIVALIAYLQKLGRSQGIPLAPEALLATGGAWSPETTE